MSVSAKLLKAISGAVTEPFILRLPVNSCVSSELSPNLVEPELNTADELTYVM